MITNQEVWDRGEDASNWSCDIDPETGETVSNGGIEHLVILDGKEYRVITSWDEEVVYRANEECLPIPPTEE